LGSTRLACDDNGVTSFNHVRYRHHDESIFLYAFDLIELNGDLRPDPLESRKATLEMILAKAGPGIRFNEHIEGDRPTVFAHACKLGLEGIVSKRKDSPYRSGRSPRFLREAPYVRPARTGAPTKDLIHQLAEKFGPSTLAGARLVGLCVCGFCAETQRRPHARMSFRPRASNSTQNTGHPPTR
jgi:ATP dependent DNA ligase domain